MAKNYLLKRAFIGLGFKYLREKDRIAKNKKQAKQAKKKATEKAINDVMNKTLGKNATFVKTMYNIIITLSLILAFVFLVTGAFPVTIILVIFALMMNKAKKAKLEEILDAYLEDEE